MFEGRVQLLNFGELPGAALYNELARAIKYSGTTSPFLHIIVNAAGGMVFDLDPVALKRELGSELPFSASLDGKLLNVRGGRIWLCDRLLEVEGIEDLEFAGKLAVWVRFTRSKAELRTGKSFPLAVEVDRLRCNLPIAEVIEEKDKSLTLLQRFEGDAVIYTMPHIFLPGFDAGKTLFRMCRNGNERYIEVGECEEDE